MTIERTIKQELLDFAIVCREQFNGLNDAYLEVHKQISHSKPIDGDLLHDIQFNIDKVFDNV